MCLGQLERGGPGVVVGVGVNFYWKKDKFPYRGIAVTGVNAFAFNPNLQGIGDFQMPKHRNDCTLIGYPGEERIADHAMLVGIDPTQRD